MAKVYDDPYDGYDTGYGGGYTPPPPSTSSQKRYNTTANWQDAHTPPSPSDPYYAEWRAANPGIPESAAEPIGGQLNAIGNTPYNPTPATNTGGGNNSFSGGLPSPFTSSFTAPSQVNLGGPAGIPYIPPVPGFQAPGYTPPPAFSYPSFAPPSMQDVLNEPGYGFGLSQGLQAVTQNKAARGLLNSGDTLKAVNNYAGDYATQRYGGSYDRMLNTWQQNMGNAANIYATNLNSQYKMPYDIAFQNATSTFAPQMEQWRVQGQAGQRENELDYSRAYDKWLEEYRQKIGTASFLRDTASS